MSPVSPRDVRSEYLGIRPGTPELKARIAAAAHDAGVSSSTWVRDLLLGKAGVQDLARRRATRRPNEQPRKATAGTAPAALRVSPREMAAFERKAARRKMSVSEWARVVIAKELDREGQQR